MLVCIAMFGYNSTMCDGLSAGVHVNNCVVHQQNQACVLVMTFYEQC